MLRSIVLFFIFCGMENYHISYEHSSICKAIDYIRFEIFTAVAMKNCVFWDVTAYCSC
jgi:hypothetical protein